MSEFEYCPKGHRHIFLPSNMLFGDCYYCPTCDKIYHPVLVETAREYFEKHFTGNRFNEIKEQALMTQARQRVSKDDLIKLGLLNPQPAHDRTPG